MATLDELVFYCKMKEPAGALALVGESGSGKSHLVDTDLTEALRDSHVIIRVSLFGVGSLGALRDKVKELWIYALLPVCSKFSYESKGMVAGRSLMKALQTVLKLVDPRAGAVSDASSRILDNMEVLPVVEDVHSKTKKRVVLVFDDLDCTTLNMTELMGVINDYGENRGFHTIVVANRTFYSGLDAQLSDAGRMAKEKAIAYTVYDYPDFGGIIRGMIENGSWKSGEYAEFLKAREDTVITLFANEGDGGGDGALEKCHNLRSLRTGLESFFRVHHYLTEAGVEDLEPYLCSFLSFYLADKSGIRREGKVTFSFTDEELRLLYPRFSPKYLFASVRQWIHESFWDKALFLRELEAVQGKPFPAQPEASDAPTAASAG